MRMNRPAFRMQARREMLPLPASLGRMIKIGQMEESAKQEFEWSSQTG